MRCFSSPHGIHMRKMQGVWASVRESAKCVCKPSVEVLSQEDRVKRGTRLSRELSAGRRSERTDRAVAAAPRRRISEHGEASAHFVELNKGDESRNIVEMIYQAAVRDSERPVPVIWQVLKVENSVAMLKRFEKHRDHVIKRAETEKKDDRHPRVLVDGNELLQFYCASMRCCGPQRSDLCDEFSCGVCRTIRTGFEYNEKKGIVFGGSSEDLHRDRGGSVSSKMRNVNVRRAVIICRIIAGVMGYMNEKIEACDSVRSPAGAKLDYMIVRNPRAVLPCFVLVFEI
uniref:Uncharacterized protein n=1 Tax=Kalanchoe fedtschenkoi TaxID=63787 RepID=A0A7N0UDB9_KALFE